MFRALGFAAALFFTATPAARPAEAEVAREMLAVLDRALAAYNAEDAQAFGAEFAATARPPMTPETFRAVFLGLHRPELGAFRSREVLPMATAPVADAGVLTCAGVFEKASGVILGANFTREGAALKLVQLRFERPERLAE